MCSFVPLSICSSVQFSVCSFFQLSICSCVQFSMCSFIQLSICSFVPLSICSSVQFSVCSFFQLSICSCVQLSICSCVQLFMCPFRLFILGGCLLKNRYCCQSLNFNRCSLYFYFLDKGYIREIKKKIPLLFYNSNDFLI